MFVVMVLFIGGGVIVFGVVGGVGVGVGVIVVGVVWGGGGVFIIVGGFIFCWYLVK